VSLRGSAVAQVLVLVDGVRLNDSRQGAPDLSQIPVGNIERASYLDLVDTQRIAAQLSQDMGAAELLVTGSFTHANKATCGPTTRQSMPTAGKTMPAFLRDGYLAISGIERLLQIFLTSRLEISE